MRKMRSFQGKGKGSCGGVGGILQDLIYYLKF